MLPNQILSFLKDVSTLCLASSLKCLHLRLVMACFFNTAPWARQDVLTKPINKKNNCISVYQPRSLSLILICILPLKAKSRTRGLLVFISCLPNGTLLSYSSDQDQKSTLSYDYLMTLFGSFIFPGLYFLSIKLKIEGKAIFVFLIEPSLN